jgi:hypothetical protein
MSVRDVLRAAMPGPMWNWCRRFGTVLIGPTRFAWQKGYLASAVRGRAVDRDGNPLPWYAYPAIDFLSGQKFTGHRVLEFGAGQSTLWWAARGADVTALEFNDEWRAEVTRRLDRRGVVHGVDFGFTMLPESVTQRQYDVVAIDGGDRTRAAQWSLILTAADGLIIHDNSEHPAHIGHVEIPALLARHGWRRVDFFGLAPGTLREQCTSIYWKADRRFCVEDPPRAQNLVT